MSSALRRQITSLAADCVSSSVDNWEICWQTGRIYHFSSSFLSLGARRNVAALGRDRSRQASEGLAFQNFTRSKNGPLVSLLREPRAPSRLRFRAELPSFRSSRRGSLIPLVALHGRSRPDSELLACGNALLSSAIHLPRERSLATQTARQCHRVASRAADNDWGLHGVGLEFSSKATPL
jgi:hypothetical protein